MIKAMQGLQGKGLKHLIEINDDRLNGIMSHVISNVQMFENLKVYYEFGPFDFLLLMDAKSTNAKGKQKAFGELGFMTRKFFGKSS